MLGGQKDIDYVICLECGKPFQTLRTGGHLLSVHKMTLFEYKAKHPDAVTIPLKIDEKIRWSESIAMQKVQARKSGVVLDDLSELAC